MEKEEDLFSSLNPTYPNIYNYSPFDYVNYLRDHPAVIEKFFVALFKVYSPNNFDILRELIKSLPSISETVLKTFFTIQDPGFDSFLITKYSELIKVSFLKYAKISYEQLTALLAKTMKPPYSIFSKIFVKDDPQLREYYEKVNPEIYKIIDDDEDRLYYYIQSLAKTGYFPEVAHHDTNDPRKSKYGGSAPYLPCSGPLQCECLGEKLKLIFSLYIPSLPDEINGLFPSNHEYVLAAYTCNSCYRSVFRLYTDTEIDELVYDDIPSPKDAFNEARVVVRWTPLSMLPAGLDNQGFSLPNSENLSQSDFIQIEAILNENQTCFGTYLGGYPFFIQGDHTPSPRHRLLMEMMRSEAATNYWGDCGAAQVWMTTGDDFGEFVLTSACS